LKLPEAAADPSLRSATVCFVKGSCTWVMEKMAAEPPRKTRLRFPLSHNPDDGGD
jgi:hypothetical protein